MENKSKFLNEISPCGDMSYTTLVELINQLTFDDDQIKIFIIQRLSRNRNLTKSDWRLIFMHIEYEDGFDKYIPLGWIDSGCKMTGEYFKILIEYAKLRDYDSTFLLTEDGDILITE